MSSTDKNSKLFPRGSEWRVWDLHIHTPASFQWEGEKFSGVEVHDAKLVDAMIEAMNTAEPAVFAIMDYWTFDGWFKLQKRLKEPDAPKLLKTVFPGIELRITGPDGMRLNVHALFSDEIAEQHLRDFKSALRLELTSRALSNDALMEYAQTAADDKLKNHGVTQELLRTDSAKALAVGQKIAELTRESYLEAVQSIPDSQAVVYMPFSTSDGLSEVDSISHYAFAQSLFLNSTIFETRNADIRAAFIGTETPGNKKWFNSFQQALDHRPRLAVAGSDAHKFLKGASKSGTQAYGEFPSGKVTWIKANPTWRGLKQAIREPAKRSFIGEIPPKLTKVSNNKTFYIRGVTVKKDVGLPKTGQWLDGCDIEFNHDLVAIIGNKGSGKSALADIIALLGQSGQSDHFSFLRKDRFRGKVGEPAKHFEGELSWHAGEPSIMRLSENPTAEQVELVRYIPQGRFESLCNDHVSGKTNEFEEELRSVIFAHVSKPDRLGTNNFHELSEKLEEQVRAELDERRKELSALNDKISEMELQLHPTVREKISLQQKLVEQQFDEHFKNKPDDPAVPSDALNEGQIAATNRIVEIDTALSNLELREVTVSQFEEKISVKIQFVRSLKNKISRLQSYYNDFLISSEEEALELKLSVEQKVKLDAETSWLLKRDEKYSKLLKGYTDEQKSIGGEKDILNVERDSKSNELDEPLREYQHGLLAVKTWLGKQSEIIGSKSDPDSQIGLSYRMQSLEQLPEKLTELKLRRLGITKKIFSCLNEQRGVRENLFEPLQKIIQNNELIREGYQLRFQAKIDAATNLFSSQLFDLVKQSSGVLRGEESSYEAIREEFEKHLLNSEQGAANLVTGLCDLLERAAKGSGEAPFGVSSILRKDRRASSVYDHIFGLRFIEPKYTLLFQDTSIEHLSPGQRGSLLLIFYLLVDDGRNPIVLDQPEENLDNQTIVSLLVPVLNEAKKNRQIFMVTHNPNLAVVCDAEQIVYAEFDRKQGSTIRYHSGAIEDSSLNSTVVDVLEGTKVAFDNRGGKYF